MHLGRFCLHHNLNVHNLCGPADDKKYVMTILVLVVLRGMSKLNLI